MHPYLSCLAKRAFHWQADREALAARLQAAGAALDTARREHEAAVASAAAEARAREAAAAAAHAHELATAHERGDRERAELEARLRAQVSVSDDQRLDGVLFTLVHMCSVLR